jgi:hypothetical protein
MAGVPVEWGVVSDTIGVRHHLPGWTISGTNAPVLSNLHLIGAPVKAYLVPKVATTLQPIRSDRLIDPTDKE